MSLSQRILDFLRECPESSAAEVCRRIDDVQNSDHAARLLHSLHKTGKVLRGEARPYRYVCADDPGLITDVPRAEIAPDQPAVSEHNTGRARPELDAAQSSAGARAAAKHAPGGHPSGAAFALSEAISRTLPPGEAIDISLDHRGTLVIATCEGELELSAEQTLALGDFLQATQGVWRP